MESDLNFIMRKIWDREIMKHNEIGHFFYNNQYGGRKGRQPTSEILNKVLTLDITRYYGDNMIIIDNDAKACYDRVIPYVTLYMLRRLGMPPYLGRFMCNILKSTNYTIKTGTGPTTAYSNSDERLFGTGQGAGWSPPCWAANSDVISCVVEKYTPGMQLMHPNQSITSHRHIDAFVDDSSLGVTQSAYNAFHPEPTDPVQKGSTLYEQAKLNAQFYSRLLFTTGGLLAIHKCIAYVLIFRWVNGIKKLDNNKEKCEPIRIRQGINQGLDSIILKNPHEVFRMLGGFVAPDGNTKMQVEVLYKKSKAWAVKITSSRLNVYEAFETYQQILIPALIYPLGAIPVREDDCRKMLGPALKALLPKLGLEATLSRNIVHTVPRYGGPDIMHIYTQAGIMKIKIFLCHWRKGDETAKILRISLGCCQQEIGIGHGVLQKSFEKYSWILQDCWVKELWKFLSEINGTIQIEDDWIQERCENDTFLMQIIYEMALSKDQIRQLNVCRLAKHITFLSEILHHDKQTLSPTTLTPNIQTYTNMYEIFPLIKVPDKYWILWSSVLRTIKSSFTVQISMIGKLLDPSNNRWLVTTDGRYVYQLTEDGYSIHRLSHSTKDGDFNHKKTLFVTTIESNFHLRWITPICTQEYIQVSNKGHSYPLNPTGTSFNVSQMRSALSKFHTSIKQRLTQRTKTNRVQHNSETSTSTLPAPKALTAHYDSSNHDAYRHWWETHRPIQVQPPKPLTTKEAKEFHFTHPSAYDHDFISVINNLKPPIR